MANPQAPAGAVVRFDAAQSRLSRDGAAVELEPKALELLGFFVANAGRIVSREELVDAVWGGLSISSDAVRYAIKGLRRALHDRATDPGFVETVARRGWRFVATALPVSDGVWILEPHDSNGGDVHGVDSSPIDPFVGREAELGDLLDALSHAQRGQRTTLVVRGDPGIGKTRLVDAFLETARRVEGSVCVSGFGAEHVGSGMPYAPLFDVLEQLAQRLGRDRLAALLRQEAPTWLVQMPELTSAEERFALEASVQGATQTRMVREWARLIESISEDAMLVLVVEDLQWADPSTIDALLFLARRSDPARLLLLVTSRPATTPAEPWAEIERRIVDLANRGGLRIVEPSAFDRASIEAYLVGRFGLTGSSAEGRELVDALVATSDGNPLFVVSLVDEWLATGHLQSSGADVSVSSPLPVEGVPDRLKPLIERQLSSLEPPLHEILQAASLVGQEFCAEELSAALERPLDEIESDCDGLLADGRFVVARGAQAWPDGAISSRYRFSHALHRNVLFESVSEGRRSRMSLKIATRMRQAFAGSEDAVAAELAMHLERGLDFVSAADFRARAGERAARRFANLEAVTHFRRALALIERGAERAPIEIELRVRLSLCAPLAAVAGYASPELEENLARLEQATSNFEDTVGLFPAILGIWSLDFVRADFGRTAVSGARMLALASRADAPVLTLQAHQSAGHSLFYQGRVLEAQRHYEQAIERYDPGTHSRQDYSVGDDPLVLLLSCRSLSEWFLGRADEATESAQAAVTLGERLGHPPSLALACTYGAVLHQLRGDVDAASEWSERSLEITRAEGIALWRELSRVLHGWSVAQRDAAEREEGLHELRAGIEGWMATGARLGLPHFLGLQASVEARTTRVEDALATLERARRVAKETGQALFGSQTERLAGEVLAMRARSSGRAEAMAEARSCYRRAAEEAEARGLRAPALRAWLGLFELEPASAEVRRRLEAIVDSAPAGARMDADLERARARLDGAR